MSAFTLPAEVRNDMGKGASRRLRRENKVPAIVYGDNQEPQTLSVPANILNRFLEEEAFYTSIFDLDVDGSVSKVVLKDLQRHPSKPVILHMDMQRTSETVPMRKRVPLHFINEASSPGVKAGGQVIHNMIEVNVRCLSKDLPEFIEVDAGEMEAGTSLYLRDMTMPENVELLDLYHGATHNPPVVTIKARRGK